MKVDIQKELNEIQEGRYGKDIRWPIYIALSKIALGSVYLFIVDNEGNFMTDSEGDFITAKMNEG